MTEKIDLGVTQYLKVVKFLVLYFAVCRLTTMEVLSVYDILKGLSDLREEGTLCDIELQAEGKTISAHRVVLASVSPYFKALFSVREHKH